MNFDPRLRVSHAIDGQSHPDRAGARVSRSGYTPEAWTRQMGQRALVLEAHHTAHIEGTRLTLKESERLLAGESVRGADTDDVRELLNYRNGFEFVSDWPGRGGPLTEGPVREVH